MIGLWAAKNLRRHPLRTGLALAGIAVASALLLDMVMLSGGMERSFERLLLSRGFQIRLSPKGTLPFDSEATIGDVSALVASLRVDPRVAEAGAVLATTIYARRADSLMTLIAYGIDPRGQAFYRLQSGNDLAPDDTLGLLLGAPAATRARLRIGDTVMVLGRLDPQAIRPVGERKLVVRGMVQWLYDSPGEASVGALLPVVQALVGQRRGDRASAVVVRARQDSSVDRIAADVRRLNPRLEVNSVATLVTQFRTRLTYFRQLSLILGTISLVVTVLLVSTILTITVHERVAEIATLRAIGVSRFSVVRQILVEGAALTIGGTIAGLGLGLITARYLDGILRSFPGLPAAISFFVADTRSLSVAGGILLVAGALAGCFPAWRAASGPIAETLRMEAT